MTTLTDQLAAALRVIERATVFAADGTEDVASITIKRGSPEWTSMSKALAAYDAQRAQQPATAGLIEKLVAALRAIPSDEDEMRVEGENGGYYYFCCKNSPHLNIEHWPDCWYVRARETLAAYDAQRAQQAEAPAAMDVLAELDRRIEIEELFGPADGTQSLRQVRAAVAELIRFDLDYDDIIDDARWRELPDERISELACRYCEDDAPTRERIATAVKAARAAALARCTPQP